ncbi:hypothetical protein ACWD5R_32005 [Streptomyces sp. NPDC002514]|uniref:hypothetical protein n=1 Tax=Streptomyces sp. NPDC001270 TaxID=3364554 RepID=UPI00367EBCBE
MAGGILVSAVWLWSETSDFPGLLGRLTFVTLALIPAAIVSGIVAIVAGFVMPLVVGAIKAGIALARWVSRRRTGE